MFQANHTFGSYHRYVKHAARETIRSSHLLNDGSISTSIYKKIQWYMVELVFIGEILANLKGHSINHKEKEDLIYLGAIMALFDVMVDDFKLEKKEVFILLDSMFSYEKGPLLLTVTSIERLFHLYVDRLDITSKEYYPEVIKHLEIIRFQIQSEEQFKGNVTEENVIKITMGKGGVSILLCSAVLFPTSDTFKKAMYDLGGFIQMMNDCQDIYKDTINGIKTFVHFSKSFSEIFNKLDEQRKISFYEIKSLSCSHQRRYETLFYLNAMFIVISYKLQRYAEACNYNLNFKNIAASRKANFTINPFSPVTIAACLGKIARFDFESIEKTPKFKFDSY